MADCILIYGIANIWKACPLILSHRDSSTCCPCGYTPWSLVKMYWFLKYKVVLRTFEKSVPSPWTTSVTVPTALHVQYCLMQADGYEVPAPHQAVRHCRLLHRPGATPQLGQGKREGEGESEWVSEWESEWVREWVSELVSEWVNEWESEWAIK